MIVFEFCDQKCKILWKGSFAKCMRFIKEYVDENYEKTVFKKYFDYDDYINVDNDAFTCYCERTEKFIRFTVYSSMVESECVLYLWYSEDLPKKETDICPELLDLSKSPLFSNHDLLFYDLVELMKHVADFAEVFGGEINSEWYSECCVMVDLDPYGNIDMDEWLAKNLPEEFDYEYVYNNGDEILDHVQFGFKTEASRYFSLNGVGEINNCKLKYHVGKTAIVVYDECSYYVWAIPAEDERNHRISCPTAWFSRCRKPENFEELLRII